jgi:hypothetical protein
LLPPNGMTEVLGEGQAVVTPWSELPAWVEARFISSSINTHHVSRLS